MPMVTVLSHHVAAGRRIVLGLWPCGRILSSEYPLYEEEHLLACPYWPMAAVPILTRLAYKSAPHITFVPVPVQIFGLVTRQLIPP